MTAETLLLDYGYTKVGDDLIPARPSSERWHKVDGGYECYALPTLTFGGGPPWGQLQEGGLVKVPYSQLPNFKQVSGLHPSVNPECFEWVWPEERLVEIYEHAPKSGPNPYVKVQDPDGSYHFETA